MSAESSGWAASRSATIVQRRQKKAGVEDFSPHDARRTVLANLLRNEIHR